MKPNLLILTNNFPNDPLTSESWLGEEIFFTNVFFNTIVILPEANSNKHVTLPENCTVAKLMNPELEKLSLKETMNCFRIVLSDFLEYPSKSDYFKSFRNNLALIKNLTLKAKNISKQLTILESKTIVYAYWADNLLTTACILRQLYKSCKIVSRGHGFEIFEEQTKYNVIPFRAFQNKLTDKILADSKNGCSHLTIKNPKVKIYDYSYVGTLDRGMAVFNQDEIFTIVTCSHIRSVKRLDLMSEILKHISFPLVWNVIGEGDDLERLKVKNSKLPENIKINYIGNLTNKEVLEFYKTKHTNLFVSLSSSEGLPVSMMEAISFGIPLLSTDVGGCSEICNSETGILIGKTFSGKSVSKLIEDFKSSNKNSLQFRENVRRFWQSNFDAKVNYTKFAEKINEI